MLRAGLIGSAQEPTGIRAGIVDELPLIIFVFLIVDADAFVLTDTGNSNDWATPENLIVLAVALLPESSQSLHGLSKSCLPVWGALRAIRFGIRASVLRLSARGRLLPGVVITERAAVVTSAEATAVTAPEGTVATKAASTAEIATPTEGAAIIAAKTVSPPEGAAIVAAKTVSPTEGAAIVPAKTVSTERIATSKAVSIACAGCRRRSKVCNRRRSLQSPSERHLHVAHVEDLEILAGDRILIALSQEAHVIRTLEILEFGWIPPKFLDVVLDGARVLHTAMDQFIFAVTLDLLGQHRCECYGRNGQQRNKQDQRDEYVTALGTAGRKGPRWVGRKHFTIL